jgi:hypothetical protein
MGKQSALQNAYDQGYGHGLSVGREEAREGRHIRMPKALTVTAADENGRLFNVTVWDPQWVPMRTRDIGAAFEPMVALEVSSDVRTLYSAPYGRKARSSA